MRGKDATFWETPTTGSKHAGLLSDFLILRGPWEAQDLIFACILPLGFVPKMQGPDPQLQAAHDHVSLLVSLVCFHSGLFMLIS